MSVDPHVYEVKIEWEEDGCWLILSTDEQGDAGYRIADPEQLYDRVKGAIGPWLRERDEARASMPAAFACDPDESGGVIDMREPILEIAKELGLEDAHWESDASDPKHPDFHSVHADIWDAREGK